MSNKDMGVSRRNFLKGAALAGVGAAGVAALGGCAQAAPAEDTSWMPASWDYETDVLVIGYGGAGMWASLIAADECAQQVLVLEKAPIEGGGKLSSVDGFGMLTWRELDAKRQELGIEVMCDCHDEELIQNPVTKEIVGCYTLIGDDTTPKAVKARKGVIMCTGGFEFNEELKNYYSASSCQKERADNRIYNLRVIGSAPVRLAL